MMEKTEWIVVPISDRRNCWEEYEARFELDE